MRHGFSENRKDGVLTLSVPSFDETGLALNAFTTRLGGISKPPLEEMNLGYGRGEDRETVSENYRILGNTLGFPHSDLVAFSQVHKNDVCVADISDAGEAHKLIKREFDAVITNVSNLPIATYHADCVPIFLLDPKKKVCGVCHAGWRGTVLKTPFAAVEKMQDVFGSDPKDILAAIGPAIGPCCFECDSDVSDAALDAFGKSAEPFITDDKNGKFHVSLPGLNTLALLESGVLDENITLSDECTFCKSDIYWSHRKTHGVRGAMAAIIMLK